MSRQIRSSSADCSGVDDLANGHPAGWLHPAEVAQPGQGPERDGSTKLQSRYGSFWRNSQALGCGLRGKPNGRSLC